jgi:hypothetical protein
MLPQIQVGDRVFVSYHLGACSHPACASGPLVGTVIKATPTPLGTSFFVRLPCGAEPLYTDGWLEVA